MIAAEPEAGNVVFVDASALVALADRDDAAHEAAVAAYRDLVQNQFRFFTTDHALSEAHELIVAALGWEVARAWLAHCEIFVLSVELADLEEARHAIEAGRCDLDASLADAIHLAVLDRLSVTDVFAVNQRFLRMLG